MVKPVKLYGMTWIKVAICAILFACPAVLLAQSTQAVLDMAPANAEVVVAVPDLAKANKKLANLNAILGMPTPWMNDTLGELKRVAGMNNGWDDQRGFAIAINGLADLITNEGKTPPVFTLIIPVKDYAAFIGNFNTTPSSDGLTTIHPSGGENGYVREVNQYAIIGSSRDAIKAYTPAKHGQALMEKTGKLSSQYSRDSDGLVIVNFDLVAPVLMPKLTVWLEELETNLKNQKELSEAEVASIIDSQKRFATAFIQGTSALMFGFDIGDLGIGFSSAIQLKANSELASYFKTNNASAAQLLAWVSTDPYFFTFAQNLQILNMDNVSKLINDLMKHNTPEMANLVKHFMPLLVNAKGISLTSYPGQMNLSGSLFNGSMVVNVDNTKTYVESFQNYIATLAKTSLPVTFPLRKNPGDQKAEMTKANINFVTQYTPNTTNVQGVAIDQYEIRVDLPPAMLAQGNQGMMILLGLTTQRGYIAQVDGKVVITTSTDLPTLTRAIDAAKQGKGLSTNPGVTQIRQKLTPQAAMEGYLDLGTIARTSLDMARQFGLPVDVQVPENLPPVGYSSSFTDNAFVNRAYLPMDVIKFTKNLTVVLAPMFMDMMQGPQGQTGSSDTPPSPPRQ